jgi:hypothetical protein
MTSRRRTSGTVAALCCALALGCADFSRGPATPIPDAGAELDGQTGDGASTDDGAALSFAASIHPLMAAACHGCHAVGQQAGDTQLLLTSDAAADYVVVMRFVDTSAPAGSRLLSKMSGNGHGGGAVYAASTPEYQTVLHWIQQGARP